MRVLTGLGHASRRRRHRGGAAGTGAASGGDPLVGARRGGAQVRRHRHCARHGRVPRARRPGAQPAAAAAGARGTRLGRRGGLFVRGPVGAQGLSGGPGPAGAADDPVSLGAGPLTARPRPSCGTPAGSLAPDGRWWAMAIGRGGGASTSRARGGGAGANPVYAVDACRTPVGKIKGALATVRPDHLSADVIAGLLARNRWLDPARIDDVYWGAANQAGEDNRNVARMAALLAGLPVEIPGATVNRLCGSGMEAIACAARAIAAGEADVCLAGGAESMTRAPFVLPRAEGPFPREAGVADTRLGWRLVSPRMAEMYPPISLGETAENVADRYQVTRERQDEFALRSHQRAAAARDAGRFADEIVPVTTPAGDVTADEGIRDDLTLAELAAKQPAFRRDGTVTGGNSSPLNDGAAVVLLVSERTLASGAPDPMARYVGAAAAGVHPDYMGIGPVPAMGK